MKTNKYMSNYNISDAMDIITENDVKDLKMSIGYKRKSGKINIKDYSDYKDFEKVFNKMPKSKPLVKGVESELFSITTTGLTKQESIFLPENYTEKELINYFDFIKKSFKRTQKENDVILLQKRYSKGKNKTTIVIYKNDSFSKTEAIGLLLFEYV
jgi:hypothetical protein